MKIDNRRMARDFAHRALRQFTAGRDFVPGRCAGGMRQRTQIKVVTGALDAISASDNWLQFFAIDELRDRKTPHRNNKPRPQDSQFIVDPTGTVLDFIENRNAICSAVAFPGETSANRGEINL